MGRLLRTVVIICVVLMSRTAYASHPPGLIRGSWGAATDGDHGTYITIRWDSTGILKSFYFSSDKTIEKMLYHALGDDYHEIRFYDASGSLVAKITEASFEHRGRFYEIYYLITNNSTTIKNLPEKVYGVRRIDFYKFFRSASDQILYELEFYEYADTTPPPAPGNLTTTPGGSRVTLQWPAVTASDLAGYRVYMRPAGTSTWTRVADVPASQTTYTVQGLENGRTYEFGVSAFDQAGNESAHATATATPVDTTPPPAPASLTATPGDGRVTLQWPAVTASDLAGYRVYVRPAGTSTWTRVADVPASQTTYTVQGLENGRTYEFGVSAFDQAGNESARATATATPVNTTPPPAPGSLAAAPGNGRVALTWSPSTDQDVAAYRVYYRRAGAAGWSLAAELARDVTAHTITGLQNEVTYEFAVTALDVAGNESPPATATATPTIIPPNPPAGLTAVPGDGQVQLSWQASPPPPDPAGYRVYYREAGSSMWTRVAQLGPEARGYTVGGLRNGVTYEFAVRAHTEDGESQPATAQATPRGPDAEPPPAPQVEVAPGVGGVTLRWQAVEAADLAGYRVYVRSRDGLWRRVASVGPDGLSYTVLGLQPGHMYEFGVSSVDEAGNESAMAVVQAAPRWVSFEDAFRNADWPARALHALGQWAVGVSPIWGIVAGLILATKLILFGLSRLG